MVIDSSQAKAKDRRRFTARLAAVPLKPGVYLLRDRTGNLLYVGKASVLRNRLRSYFQSQSGADPKMRRLFRRIADFEYIVTESEQEALLLENSLIKEHQPPFNARLRDDKTYPYIRIGLEDPFPRVEITRRTGDPGARYFGPFASAGSVRRTLELLKRLFPYCSCNRTITGKDERPCLDYHIGRCLGPCVGAVSQEEYREVIDQVIKFLEGKTGDVVSELKSSMEAAAIELNFERAAALRDRLRAIERVYEGQKVVSPSTNDDSDAIAVAQGTNEAWVEAFFIRQGKLVDRDHFIMAGTQDEQTADIIGGFIKQFYASAVHVPRRILVEEAPEDSRLIETWLSGRAGRKVRIFAPKRGEKRRLIAMVRENAGQGLEQLKLKWMADAELMETALADLQEYLHLPRFPSRIECYDVSHVQGTNVVASMAVFENGTPHPSHYRRFRIKQFDRNDDFAALREVMARRFKRLQKALDESKDDRRSASDSFGCVPDLVLIDGGKGQLSAVFNALSDLGVFEVPLASLAKRHEEVFIPGRQEPVILPRSSQALFLLQRIRDEAHRFAVTFHRSVRSKASVASTLDLVPGIGPKRKRQLLRHFGSIKRIRDASVEELASSPGMTLRLAKAVKNYI